MKNRIKMFFVKLISIKVIIWYGSVTVLLFMEKVTPLIWLIVSGMVFAARTTEKIIMKYLEKENEK